MIEGIVGATVGSLVTAIFALILELKRTKRLNQREFAKGLVAQVLADVCSVVSRARFSSQDTITADDTLARIALAKSAVRASKLKQKDRVLEALAHIEPKLILETSRVYRPVAEPHKEVLAAVDKLCDILSMD